jgi:hypothetical protein
MHNLALTDNELVQLVKDLRLLACLNYNPDARHDDDRNADGPVSLAMLQKKLGKLPNT